MMQSFKEYNRYNHVNIFTSTDFTNQNIKNGISEWETIMSFWNKCCYTDMTGFTHNLIIKL